MSRRIAVFMGTRPEAIKLAPVVRQLQRTQQLEAIVVNSGQHREMIQQVIDLFDIQIDAELQVMQPDQSLAGLTARLIERIDAQLSTAKPDFVLAQGDTTTVLCTAIASFYRQIPFGHVEAGLRTNNLRAPFPEEANRRLVSPLTALHFCPTSTAREALLAEGIDERTIVVTGNTVVDALLMEIERQSQPDVENQLQAQLGELIGGDWLSRPLILVTGHRRENFGDGFDQICEALAKLAAKFPESLFVYPVHLNPRVQLVVTDRLQAIENIRLISPLPYSQFVALAKSCRLILTDSGGLQEEAPSLGKPVLVMRETTERPEGVVAGAVKLVGAKTEQIVAATTELLTDDRAYQKMTNVKNPYGDGRASERIVEQLLRVFDLK